MIVIIDCNKIISALLSPNGVTADIILRTPNRISFIAPHYIFSEIFENIEKIRKVSKYSQEEFYELLYILFKKIDLIDEDLITRDCWNEAFEYTKDIDEKDTPYIALSLYTKVKLWTGDKALKEALKKKGFMSFIETEDLLHI